MSKRLETLIATNDKINYQNREIILSLIKKEQSKTKKSKADRKRFWFTLLEMFLPFLLEIVAKIQQQQEKEGIYYLEITKDEANALFEETLYDDDAFEGEWAMRDKGVSTLIMKLKDLKKAVENDNTDFL